MVPPETVFAQRFADVLVLRITSFSNSTASHLALSVQDALSEPHPVGGIVLDLRDNRGGLLRQAVTAADTFLPAGLVATTVGRDPDAVNIWRSTEGELAQNVPLIILVDGRTASAAEILAAALADRGRAVVVGSETVGKGMVQTHRPAARRRRTVRHLEPDARPAGLADPGAGRDAAGLHQPGDRRRWAASLPRCPPGSSRWPPRSGGLARPGCRCRPRRCWRSERLARRRREGAADLDAARALIANPAAYAAALLAPIAGR